MRDHEIKALQASLDRIATSLEVIAAKPVILDGTNHDTEEMLDFLVADFDPKTRPWNFLIQVRKPDAMDRDELVALFEEKLSDLVEAAKAEERRIVDLPLPDEEVGWDGGPQTLGHDIYEEGTDEQA